MADKSQINDLVSGKGNPRADSPFCSSPFTLKSRLLRVLWALAYNLLYRISPRPFHAWRCFLLRMFGAKVGRGVHPYPGMKVWAPWNLELGDYVGIADDAELYSQGTIKIGRRSVISQGVYICTGSHDYSTREHAHFTAPVVIGEDVWLAARVFIHPGVAVPDGVVIGACSVVVKSPPAWFVCAGNPCRPIKPRKWSN